MSATDTDNASLNVTELLLNATENILQRVNEIANGVKQQNNGYNWDPATFAVTVIIGIIAIFFAGLAIIQGLLASGPGRLKCGRYAIGPWSQFTTRKFDWFELRFRTIAYTPVIDSTSLTLGQDKPNRSNGDQVRISIMLGRKIDLRNPLRKEWDEYFPATWLALLTYLNVDHPNLWRYKATGADYIPAELSSVPAYGNMRDVINLALILSNGYGRLEIDSESRLPSVQTQWFGLNFRSHPLLGLVGSFETYDPSAMAISSRPKPELIGDLKKLFGLASGYSDATGGGKRVQIQWFRSPRQAQTGMTISASRYRFRDSFRCFANATSAEFQCQCTEGKIKAFSYIPDWDLENIVPKLASARLYRFFALTRFKPAKDEPIVFPHESIHMLKVLQPFLLQSTFWLQGAECYGYPTSKDICGKNLSQENLEERVRANKNGDNLDIDPETRVFGACLDFLHSFSKQPKDEQLRSIVLNITFNVPNGVQGTQAALKHQLDAIDGWVSQEAIQDIWACRAQAMSIVASLTHLAAECHIGWNTSRKTREVLRYIVLVNEGKILDDEARRRVLEYIFSEFSLSNHEKEIWDAVNELEGMWTRFLESGYLEGINAKHPLDDLIIYRAILSVMYLVSTIDNSTILENEAYNRIIPIL